jgi:DnaK suppressor protein
VTEALARIEDGTYGRCAQCEAEISPKRLSAVPWTAYCLACQAAVDQSNAQVTEVPLVRFGGKSLDF